MLFRYFQSRGLTATPSTTVAMKAAQVIESLELAPHPEGGWYRETFRDTQEFAGRPASTAIYYLLDAGEVSHWHRVDAAEVWLWHAGAPLVLTISPDGHNRLEHQLGSDLQSGQQPQIVVPAGQWQSAATSGGWTLVSCTVSPGFQFEGFEMAPPDWQPTDASSPKSHESPDS